MNQAVLQREDARRELINRLFQEKRLRPTVVVVLLDQLGAFFVGKQGGRNKEGNLSLVQGGIDPGETVLEATRRELSEELGVEDRHIFEITDLNFTAQMPYPPDRPDKLGFTEGKMYFCVGVILHTNTVNDLPDMLAAHIGPGREITREWWENPYEAIRLCIEQPNVPAATDATREKGRTVLCPAILAMVKYVTETGQFSYSEP